MTAPGEDEGVPQKPASNGAHPVKGRDAAVAPAPDPRTLRPPIPVARRLNRNALTIAAALAGVTVLTVIAVTNPSRPGSGFGAPPAATDRTPAVPAHAAFLDQPPRIPSVPRRVNRDSSAGEVAVGAPGIGRAAVQTPTGYGSADARLALGPGLQAVGSPLPATASGGVPAGGVTGAAVPGPDPGAAGEYGMYGSGAAGYGPRSSGEIGARAQAYQAALTSSVFSADANREPASIVSSSGGGAYPGGPVTDPAVFNGAADMATAARAAAAAQPRPNAPPGATQSAIPPAWLNGVVAAHLDSAGSPYTIWAGTLIPGLLITGLNSDLPGEVVGQMSRDVYDSRTQQILLLPKGSRLIGAYDNRSVATGRIIVSWTRLILPDGRSLTLPRLAATDQSGQAGLHDLVDAHYAKIYGAALMTSAITAGIQLSQPQQAVSYAAPSPGQIAAGSLGQNIGDVSLETARRGLDIPPTIIIRPGQPFNVFLTGDVAFDGPYVPEPAGGPP